MSIVPARNSAILAAASLMKRTMIPGALGTPRFQYARLASKRMRSPVCHDLATNGPVPTGSEAAVPYFSSPAARIAVGLAMPK